MTINCLKLKVHIGISITFNLKNELFKYGYICVVYAVYIMVYH